MKKALALALVMTGFAVDAYAADWVPPKVPDPIPDNLTWYGITPIGALDLGYAYQTNGRPLGSVVSGLEFSPFTTTRNYTGQAISTIAHSGLQQSFIGVRVDEPLGLGWAAIARADTGVDPLQGTLSNGCVSFLQNAGIAYNQQNSNADSGRCGQAFNGQLWGGISNKQYGTLTIGRQNSFELDNIARYDPMELSYAFSLLGYSGTDGGMGSTQAARWDNSAKYVYDFGIVHAGAMYSSGGSNTGFFGNAYGFDVGAVYQGFSIDAIYTKEHGAVNLQSAVNNPVGATTLAANISDNTAWSVMAKYTWNLGSGWAAPAPYYTKAAKAEPQHDKFTVFAGYTNLSQSNPDQPVLFGGAAGGYTLTSTAVLPDNNAFTTDKVLQFFWVGAKYELAWGLSFTGAYYHVNQNSYVADSAACIAGGASKGDCAGAYDEVSFLTDYALNKHLDVYAGAMWAQVTNGLASGYPGTPGAKFGFAGTNTSVNTATFMTGFRIKI
ncbi:porin [Bradyrhizobium sp.]|jgi:predicted porin|uniref:porin n=1 Tax=Bradyrhizobium sp. TaxID=376 RepID=UPI003BB1118A